MTAIHKGMGMGMKKIKTGMRGTITARAPARAKIPPEAPTPVVSGLARRMKRRFPARPPSRNTARKFRSPTARIKKLPRKYRASILNNICQILPCTNMLLMIVHGCCERSAGVNPRKRIISGLRNVIMEVTTFRAIRNHRIFKLTAR